MNRRIAGLVPVVALSVLALCVAGRLAADPSAWLVDGDRPSVDHAMRPAERPPGNDLTGVYGPRLAWIKAEIARLDRVPAWDSSGFGGRPGIGNPQAGRSYPPAWIVWRFGAPSTLVWLTVAHLIWGGTGVYTLSRRSSLSKSAALFAGICFQANPYVLAQAYEGHHPHVWAASWYPWAFLAALDLRRGGGRGFLTLPLILALCFLTGHAQECVLLMLVPGLWVAADLACGLRRRAIRDAGRTALAWFGTLALVVGLTAIEWRPVVSALPWSLRVETPKGVGPEPYTLQITNLLQAVSTRALGGPSDFFGRDNYWETVFSIGLAPLALAAVAWRCAPSRSTVRAWAILGILAAVVASGRKLGIYALLVDFLPGMDLFRVPSRSLFLASLAGAMLAGFGLDAVLSPSAGVGDDWAGWFRRGRRWTVFVVVGLLTGQGFAWWYPPPYGHLEWTRAVLASGRIARDPWFWLAFPGTVGAFIWLKRRPQDHLRVARALGLCGAVELAGGGFELWKTTPSNRVLGPDPVSATLAELQPRTPYRIRVRDAFYDDLRAANHGFEKTNLNDLFQVKHAADLYEYLYPIFDPPRPRFPETEHRRAVRQGVLDRMSVGFLVSDRPEADAPWPIAASGVWHDRPYWIYRNPTALPRAYVVPRVYQADDASAVDHFANVNPREAVVMASDPLGRSSNHRQPFTAASYSADDPDHVEIRVTTRNPGLLVVADTWMPGWSAEVDGLPAPILLGNHAQRVVPLPKPGRHQILMSYSAPGFAEGLAVSGISAIVWLAVAARVGLRFAPASRP